MRSLTGKASDLDRVMWLARRLKGPMITSFVKTFASGPYEESGFAKLFLRVGSQVNPVGKRKLVDNLVCNWGIDGVRKRMKLEEGGTRAPSFVVLSPSMRCNLRCTGCYSGLYAKDGELSEREIDRILAEMRSFGSYFVVVSGGEPFLLKDVWLRLFRTYNDMYFMTYTNGTLLDQATVDELARLGNVAPAISVEGYRDETDLRRGPGTFDRITAAMERLRAAGILFGISVTYTSQNVGLVTRDEFIDSWIERGALFGWYFMFMPVGSDPILSLVPSPEQRAACGDAVADMRRRLPMFLADFWNDGPAVGGCLAGGRQYLHILNSGRVEPCVFSHFGIDNIREKTVLEAANSPFFTSIRARFPYNENANLKRPCMIIDNPEVLRDVVAEHLAPAGHAHSEDLIRDPKTVKWMDDYAQRFKEIVDPVWEKEISNPESRWYREGAAYRDLGAARDEKAACTAAVGGKTRPVRAGARAEPGDRSVLTHAGPVEVH